MKGDEKCLEYILPYSKHSRNVSCWYHYYYYSSQSGILACFATKTLMAQYTDTNWPQLHFSVFHSTSKGVSMKLKERTIINYHLLIPKLCPRSMRGMPAEKAQHLTPGRSHDWTSFSSLSMRGRVNRSRSLNYINLIQYSSTQRCSLIFP